MSASTDSKLPPFQLLEEPVLSFAPDDDGARDLHPLRGLVKFGPFSKRTFGVFTPQLRVAMVGPQSGRHSVIALMKLVQQSHTASDRKEYVPAFPGFEALFKTPMHAAGQTARVSWPDTIDELPFNGSPEEKLAAAFQEALSRLETVRAEFDVVVVHLPDSWDHASRSETFNAHDALKALGARAGIPTQVLNDRSFSYSATSPASIAWRLAIALYVKAGGVPWKLAPMSGVPDGTAYIGLAYALKKRVEGTHYVTCCSQVFDMDGGGMQFVAFEARDPVLDVREAKKNPFLSRADMRAVLARSLQLYQTRNGGVLPRRLVVHKTTAFREEELQGASDALSGIPEYECIEVSSNSAWRGVWMVANSGEGKQTKPAGYPVLRGIVQMCTPTSCLVWVAGNAPGASTTGDYYQGKKSIPRPLVLTRHAGSGPLQLIAMEALALTKMDWNNDALYDPVPVTIRYSQRLARTIANVPDLPGSIYPYRLFM
jgi:hypothetical protein